jgi:hypothetical protein
MASVSDLGGVRLENPVVARLVDASLDLTQEIAVRLLRQPEIARFALIGALSAANALLAAASSKCTLDSPAADINATTDVNGNLVLRCGHSPPHEWDYQSGAKRP